MIEQIWANCGCYFEKQCDAEHFGLGKSDWGDNAKPYPTYIIYDPDSEQYYELASNMPVKFHDVDNEEIKKAALKKLTAKEKEVLGL